METTLLTERYANVLDGVLYCYDRVILTGSLVPLSYARGMAGYLSAHDFRIFDYAQFAQPLRDAIRANAQALAAAQGIEIEFVGKHTFRKEDRIQEILQARGDQPGLVHNF